MKRARDNTPFMITGALILSLTACGGSGGGGSDSEDGSDGGSGIQYQPSMALSKTCLDPSDGDNEAVAGDDIQFVLTLNNTSSTDTPALNLISATDTLLGDIAAQLPDPLPLGESTVTINHTTSTEGTISGTVDVTYQVDGTSTQLTGNANASCNVIPPYPDPNNPSEFPTQIDTEEGGSSNNSAATAGSHTIGETTYHTIYPVDDEDWLAVNLNAGTQYEFSVDNVSYNGVPKLELYHNDGTTQVSGIDTEPGYDPGYDSADSWGYFSFNPRVTFTPSAGGTYYVKVYDLAGGIASYTFSSRIFSDSDGDTYSPHYDCDDTNPLAYPWAVETADDTIDQSCSGYDWPVDTAEDAYEPDDTFNSAGSLPVLKGDPWDIIHRSEVYAETHTIDSGDVDYFKITVPAHSAYEIMEVESVGVPLDSILYASDQTTVVDQTYGPLFITHWLDNSASATATDFYLEIKADADAPSGTAAYVIGMSDGGTDMDGDGYFTRSQGAGWDCDDSNSSINAGETEAAPGDGIDSNCNGDDAS